MPEIKTFPFDGLGVDKIRAYKYGRDWPVVYIIENGKELYVGESISAYSRTKQHLENPDRKRLKTIHVISDDEFNKSATLDTESSLIEYLVADGKYILQNSNGGLQNHSYYDRENYQGKFEVLWQQLQKKDIAQKDLLQIRNSDLFKYSPYKTLTDDQYLIASALLENIEAGMQATYVIRGGPGTGKTILATYLIKQLVEKGNCNVALVIAMTSLRNTLKKVFRGIPQLSPTMVIGPNEVTNKNYDVLIVDETHRLRQRKNITNYESFDKTNKHFGFDNGGTELDWVLASAKQVILFFDEKQSVRPSDIPAERVHAAKPIVFELKTQMRVKGGEEYIRFIENVLEESDSTPEHFADYDFRIYDDLAPMVTDIKARDIEHKLCRMVAGYAWNWVSRKNKNKPDIVVGDTKLFWNSVTHDWPNSRNAINEVGCIHTIQGYDLNYTGVIIGPEIAFDEQKQIIVADAEKYMDVNGKRAVPEHDELKRYIINIYKTLLTRGILGTYVYIVDEPLRNYFKKILTTTKKISKPTTKSTRCGEENALLRSPIQLSKQTPSPIQYVDIPLVGSAPCGNPMLGEENIEEYIKVEKTKIKPGFKYFIVRAEGDSMNLAGINDGDLVLCRHQQKGETGDRVVALLGGDNVTIKYYDKRDGRRILLPKSTNKSHQAIIPDEGDSVQGVVQEVVLGNRDKYN